MSSTLEKDNIIDIFEFNNNEIKPFNLSYYSKYTNNTTLADIANLANVKKKNFFINDNYFTNIKFNISINDITVDAFDLIRYLPDIINDIQNINYVDETTYINGNSIIQNTITKDCVNTTKLVTQNINTGTMKSSNVKTNTVHTKALFINNIPFQESVGFIYINNYSLPLDINSYLFTDFNLVIMNKVNLTLKANYNIKIYDINNLLLFAVQNTTTKTMFMIDINYNSAYYRIDINLKNN